MSTVDYVADARHACAGMVSRWIHRRRKGARVEGQYPCRSAASMFVAGKWWCRHHVPFGVLLDSKDMLRREIEYKACLGVPDPEPGELAKLRKLLNIEEDVTN